MSSSSSSVSATTVNGVTRFSGLSSQIDVDSLVKSLMSTEQTKLDKLEQKKQLDTWRQEQYRQIITDVTSFTSKYLDLSSSSSILKQGNFQQFSATSSDSAVSVKATANAVAGNHTITVSQLATAATRSSASNITADITATSAYDLSSISGKSFTLTVDGTARTVSFSSNSTATDTDTQVAFLQSAINDAIGTTTDSSGNTVNKITVSTDSSGYFVLAATDGSGIGSITIADSSSNGAFSALGFSSSGNLTNRLTTSNTLSAIASKVKSGDADFIDSSSGEIAFTINGQSFSFDKTDTLSEVISKVNANTSAGVTMKYDTTADKLVLTASSSGAGNTIAVSDTTGSFMSTFFGTLTAGTDAKLTIDGTAMTRSSNTVTQDGVTYTLNSTTTSTVTASISQDTDGIYDLISNFVTAYNDLLDEINGKLDEDYDSDYQPLTDAQESSMSDTEITNWNKKAQTGLLENDSTLSSMVENIREALMSSVSGVSATLTSIGITTSTWTEKGKLHIDEDTLKSAIASNPTGVMNLFTQTSDSYPGLSTVRSYTSSERKVRTNEEGLAYKLYDILQDNVGTLMDSNGNKGLLVEKAGISDDSSASDNFISTDLDSLADRITAEEKRMSEMEDRYYTQFTNMETILEQLSSQSSILSSFSS